MYQYGYTMTTAFMYGKSVWRPDFNLTFSSSSLIYSTIFLPLFPSGVNVSGCISLHPMYGKSVWRIQKTPAKDVEKPGRLRDLIGSRWSKACQDYLTPIRSEGTITCEENGDAEAGYYSETVFMLRRALI